MAKKLYEETHVQAVADAIRTKNGKSDTYKLSEMAGAVQRIPTKETVTWHQCPEAVRNFLESVTYDPGNYTTSRIAEFAPATAVQSNTKPIGKTVDGVTYCNNVPNQETPFSSANTAGTVKPLDRLRWIDSKTNNMRDLGGWPCDGGTIKYGRLYRCGEISGYDHDLFVNQLGITMEIDLTADGTPANFDGMEFICADRYAMYALTPVSAWQTNLRALFDAIKRGRNIVFHCSMGADRTGTFACIIEGLLGVSQSDCDKDYELSSFHHLRARNGSYQGGPTWANLMSQISALRGNTFRDKCVNFVASLGFTAEEINDFRASMIDGTPDTVTPSIVSYSVTKHLTNATASGGTSIPQNQPYEDIITPADGCVMASVSVKMGNADITSSAAKTVVDGAVSMGAGNHHINIHIPSITGNVVVVASAVSGARLPVDYQEVEWIGSSGTQAIQVEFVSSLVGAYILQRIMRTNSGVRGLIGAASRKTPDSIGAAAGSYFGWNTSGYWEMGGSSVSTILSSTTQFDETKFEWTATGCGKLTVNGTVAAQRSGSGTYMAFNPFGGKNYPVSCKQKEIEVYNSTGGTKKTAHLVPCYRKADGEVGMYDMIGKEFYTNIGTGSFTKGANVT